MREVEVSRFVPATVPEVERALGPAALVEYEGSFRVLDVEAAGDTEDGDAGGATLVTAGARGLRMTLRFEAADGGWRYEQVGEEGPFDAMWTRVGVRPENEGSRVTMRSAVSLGLPVASLTDRVAAWKRRGELNRALSAIAEEFS